MGSEVTAGSDITRVRGYGKSPSLVGLCIVWMIRYDTYRDTFDPIHDTYR